VRQDTHQLLLLGVQNLPLLPLLLAGRAQLLQHLLELLQLLHAD